MPVFTEMEKSSEVCEKVIDRLIQSQYKLVQSASNFYQKKKNKQKKARPQIKL